MNLVAVLVVLGGIVGMAAVEVVVDGAKLKLLLAWRFGVSLPTLAALTLVWLRHGASFWPILAYCAVQPWMFRRWIVRRHSPSASVSA